ncbi:MAG: PDZ domain-containing protein, partial [Anaerolineales bacterium]
LHDVVVWELDHEGLECQCICPSCGLGICLCAVSSRTILSDAWAEAGPIAVDEGVHVHPPRKGSAAANAGLRSGDVILTVDGQEIQTYSVLQTAVLKPDPGEQIQIGVRREPDELEDVGLISDVDKEHLDLLRELWGTGG